MKKVFIMLITVFFIICSCFFLNEIYAAKTLEELEESAKQEWEEAWGDLDHKSWEDTKKEILGNLSEDEFQSLGPTRKQEIIDRIEQQFDLEDGSEISEYWKNFISEGEKEVEQEKEELENKKEETGKSDFELYEELYKEIYRLMNEEGKDESDSEVQKLLKQADELYQDIIINGSEEEIEEIKKMQNGLWEDLKDDNELYYAPESKKVSKSNTLDDVFNDAETLEGHGSKISQGDIQSFSNLMYNIFLAIGTVIAVIIGGVLGIQFMLSSPEGKADIKKMLITYAIGCVVLFGAFGIWKLVVTVLQNI